MRNKSDNSQSSFDLLLDTICNAFGGIVFISLLISLFIQSGVQQEDKKIKNLKPSPQPGPIKPTDLPGEIDKIKISVNGMLASIGQIKGEIGLLDGEIANAKAGQQRQLRLPRMHEITGKKTIIMAVNSGKIYIMHDLFDESHSLEASDANVEENDKGVIIKLFANKGQQLIKGSESSGKLKAALDNLNPSNEYIFFCVYKDSFAEFNQVKSLFVQKGFDYNLAFIDPDEDIKLTKTDRVSVQ